MSKITLSLTSGTTIEKPLITAFRGSMSEYVVLDNEANGTMGLPIILVSKIENNKLSKIEDQNEWGTVKEMLRNIISGNQVDYITVSNNLSGDDIFYSQLTLPIASFDALKNNYKPMVSGEAPMSDTSAPAMPSAPVTPMPNVSSVGPIASAPVAEPSPVPTPVTPAPTMEATSMPSPTPTVLEPAGVSPVTPATAAMPEMPIPPVAPAMPEVAPVMPSTPVPPVASETVSAPEPAPVMPEVAPAPTPMPTPTPEPTPVSNAPVVEPIPASPKKVDYQADKEAFLKACENMFDALVAKFNE